jgi:hypothetical protein
MAQEPIASRDEDDQKVNSQLDVDASSTIEPTVLETTSNVDGEQSPSKQFADSLTTLDSRSPSANDSGNEATIDLSLTLNWLVARTRGEKALFAVAGFALFRLCLPRLNWSAIFAGVLGTGLGGFAVAFYLLAVPEETRLKRASVLARMGKHKSQIPSWPDAEERVRTCLSIHWLK